MRLAKSRVLVVGAGGLGSAVLYYLAAAGIGTIGVVDDQDVELSNLQRQILHSTARIGVPKVVSAKQTLLALNPGITIHPYHIRIDWTNAADLVSQFDLVISALDNEESVFTRELCELEKTDGGWWSEGLLWTSAHYFARRRPMLCLHFPHKDNRPFNEQGSEDRAIPVFSYYSGIIGVLQAQSIENTAGCGQSTGGKDAVL